MEITTVKIIMNLNTKDFVWISSFQQPWEAGTFLITRGN